MVVFLSLFESCRDIVTFQQKLLLAFSVMVLPVLLVGAQALRSNVLERRALEALSVGLARTRTYAELETAMFNQSEVIWRYLTGLEPRAKDELRLHQGVVDYWFKRWSAELEPEEAGLAAQVHEIQRQFEALADTVFQLADAGRRPAAYFLARRELNERLEPALTQTNRQIYRRTRESSVQRALGRVEEIVDSERRTLFWIVLLALSAGILITWAITRSLIRPVRELSRAMAVVGAGNLEHPIEPRSRDEIGELARAFARMTENVRHSQSEMVRLNAELAAKVEQLERTQVQLIQSEKLASIGEMAAAVAHGLRNPLASLRAVAQLALHHPDSPEGRAQLSEIVAQVDRLDRRIAHLLSFSRPAVFHPQRESVPELVHEALRGCSELLRERNIECHLDLPVDLPQVWVDPMQVEQVLVELISNALDAMPGGGRLSISARQEAAEDGARVAIEITDTGRGISEQTLPSVCEPFFTTRPEGTGLGLAIAKRYVEQHGGQLDLRSRAGAGTTVLVTLPTRSPEEAQRPISAPAGNEQT